MANQYKAVRATQFLATCQTWAQSAAAQMLNDLLPARCSLCAARLAHDEVAQHLCPGCWSALGGLRLDLRRRCAVCADALPCDCARHRHRFSTTIAALAYEEPVRGLLLQLKFAARTDIARGLGALLAEQFVQLRDGPALDALLALPLSGPRLAERGFNQSQLLADAFRSELRRRGFKAPPLARGWLARLPDPGASEVHLSSLGREARQLQVRHAFKASNKVGGLRIGLLDDVMTTGATLDAAAGALMDQGARVVVCLVVARA